MRGKFLAQAIPQRALGREDDRDAPAGRCQRLGVGLAADQPAGRVRFLRGQAARFRRNQAPKLGRLGVPRRPNPLAQKRLNKTPMSPFVPLLEFNQ
jgi:hypothetical protein